MRYGRNEGHGFYGMINDKYANFTWYYVEPESNVYLYAPKILATKNKITAKLTLLHLNNYDVVDELENIKRLFSIDETLLLLNLNQLEDLILSPQRTLITSSLDNYLMDGLQIKYGYGELDGYDEAITTLARNVGIDVVIFTHQPGTAKRLVSECVDTRMRLISFQNLFTSQ